MSLSIQFLGHSTFLIESDGKKLLIDPFLTDNPQATVTADELSPDVILLTHGHGDHVADAVEIAKRTECRVISNFEINQWLVGQGVAEAHPMHLGGAFKFDFGTVKMTPALHGSMLPDGSNGGMPGGYLLTLPGGTVYIAGDTALFSDMKLIGETDIDIAILPIGDNFTMGPDDAARAVEFLGADRVIPCHYGTWPLIEQDPSAFAGLVSERTSAETVVLSPGETFSLDG